jgi:hypothetical protein
MENKFWKKMLLKIAGFHNNMEYKFVLNTY